MRPQPAEMPLDHTDHRLRVFRQHQQDILCTKHVHCLLDRRSFICSLKENRRNRVCGRALAQVLQSACGPDAVGDQHASVPSKEPADFREIAGKDVGHGTGHTDLTTGAKIRAGSQGCPQEPGRHWSVYDNCR